MAWSLHASLGYEPCLILSYFSFFIPFLDKTHLFVSGIAWSRESTSFQVCFSCSCCSSTWIATSHADFKARGMLGGDVLQAVLSMLQGHKLYFILYIYYKAHYPLSRSATSATSAANTL